jgi:hypothetical protein
MTLTLRYVSPFLDSQTSLVIVNIYFVIYFFTFLFTWKVAGDSKFKFKFGFEIEIKFEYQLEGFFEVFFKKCLGSPCYLMVVSGGSLFLGGLNKDTRRCYLWCLQVSS